jgi:hypothetical protein
MSNPMQHSTSTSSTAKALLVFVLFVFTQVAFAQDQVTTPKQEFTSTSTASSVSETLNFMSWFMGTKQNIQPGSTQDLKGSSKKQLINSGIAPNRLLLKTFSKKAANYNNAVV